MRNKLLSFRNIFFLVVGLAIIGFSAYRAARNFDQTSADMIGGEEIVVLSENTPVVNPNSSSNALGTSGTGDGSIPNAETQQTKNTSIMEATRSSAEIPAAQVGSSSQDTFLTQIEKMHRTDIASEIIPDRIVIPTIQLNAPIVVAGSRTVKVSDQIFDQWVAPNQFAAGWQANSAYLGEKGNTVINGHHNEYGKVFGNLINLKPGETIYIYSGERVFPYIISNMMILKEKNEDLKTRMSNAAWIQPSEDERLTLITCWPPETNTHRLIIVAVPFVTSPERVFG
jgi:LPXTG-site transpeptidase (sortase) family protein